MGERSDHRGGFTLIECLVVIAIIAMLIALFMPALEASRGTARRVSCQSNLMRIGLALDAYSQTSGVLPPGVVTGRTPAEVTAEEPMFGWMSFILPELDYPQTAAAIDRSVSVFAEPNDPLHTLTLPILVCPTDRTRGRSSYVGIQGSNPGPIDADENGLFFANSRLRMSDIVDGRSSTLMLSETAVSAPPSWVTGSRTTIRYATLGSPPTDRRVRLWTGKDVREGPPDRPQPEWYETASLNSLHGQYALAVMADGRGVTLNYFIDQGLLRQLADRDDREPIGGFQ